MQTLLLTLFFSLAVAALALAARTALDRRADAATWAELRRDMRRLSGLFDPAMIADLPEPARRYLLQAIAPGTPLRSAVEIDMEGQFGLGNKNDPKYAPMQARQILAAPAGFVWIMSSGAISGSDGLKGRVSWTRFRIFGLIPVARMGRSEDHRRSAFARAVAEAAFWAPASVLPGPGIIWESAGPDVARLRVSHDGLEQSVDLTLAPDGTPVSMVMPRWSNANPNRIWQVQPFGAKFSDLRQIEGVRVPFQVEAGNFFGTPDWFPFFRAQVTAIRFVT